ncbi:hypothetical protein [Streptomyces sp. JJ36]|uniref:hypothetical protein n=1 Tax=Streptomyces sp. JJ36 TaxID=2736645 RepID=UPI001F3B9E39|nr:hypothetical protein [Streptomyces sp. JJ36]MCF6525532.1 hypothetical protein [Streptomyces sp. JJ36]
MTGRVRSRRSALLASLLCAGLTTSVTACGSDDPDKGTNGVGRLPAAKIEKKARQAARNAGSVRLSGSVVSNGRTYRLEMRLKESGGIGEVSTKSDTFQLLRVRKDLYLKADADFWVHQEKGGDEEPTEADLAAAKKLDGKYVKVPEEDPAYRKLSGFTEMEVLLDGLLALKGERETGDRTEVGGTRTIQVRANDGRGGTLAVSLEGTPYPLRLTRGAEAGTVRLADWDEGFSLRAPKKEHIVDYGKKISADA